MILHSQTLLTNGFLVPNSNNIYFLLDHIVGFAGSVSQSYWHRAAYKVVQKFCVEVFQNNGGSLYEHELKIGETQVWYQVRMLTD